MKNILYTFLFLACSFTMFAQVQTDEVTVTVTELPNYELQVDFTANAALSGVDVLPLTIMFKIPDSENLAGISITQTGGDIPATFSLANSFTFGGFHYISYQTTSPTTVATFPATVPVNVGEFTIGGVTSQVEIAETDFGPPPSGNNWVGTAMVQGDNNLLDYPIINGLVSLPADVIAFNVAKHDEGSAKIGWTSANEINFSHYEVERSLDGRNFDLVSKVTAKLDITNTYELIDENIILNRDAETIVYYRLKNVDTNGAFEYSDIRSVRFDSKTIDVQLYPNPTVQTINVTANSEITDIKMYSIDGKIVLNQKVGGLIDINQFDAGMYKVVISTVEGSTTKSVIKMD